MTVGLGRIMHGKRKDEAIENHLIVSTPHLVHIISPIKSH